MFLVGVSSSFSFRRPLPAALQPPPARAPETGAEREARQLAFLRELAELNMLAAREAADRIRARVDGEAETGDDALSPAAVEPTLALVRATRAVTVVINLESRIAAGETAPAPAASDPRSLALRKLLYPFVEREPDLARRRALRERVNEGIDDALGADLDDETTLASLAGVIARRHGFPLEMSKVPDPYFFPVSDPACTDPTARLTPLADDRPPNYPHPPLPRCRLARDSPRNN